LNRGFARLAGHNVLRLDRPGADIAPVWSRAEAYGAAALRAVPQGTGGAGAPGLPVPGGDEGSGRQKETADRGGIAIISEA
jgi:hypothetical protein